MVAVAVFAIAVAVIFAAVDVIVAVDVDILAVDVVVVAVAIIVVAVVVVAIIVVPIFGIRREQKNYFLSQNDQHFFTHLLFASKISAHSQLGLKLEFNSSDRRLSE